MPAGFNQATSDIESIVGVQFSILSPEEIERSSVVEIVSQTPYEGNEPKIGDCAPTIFCAVAVCFSSAS